MNTQEIKEQAHKEFDQIYWKGKDETAYWKYEKQYKQYIALLDSLIDKTVQHERDRILGVILKQIAIHTQLEKEWTGIQFSKINPHEEKLEELNNLLPLITNKSDINK